MATLRSKPTKSTAIRAMSATIGTEWRAVGSLGNVGSMDDDTAKELARLRQEVTQIAKRLEDVVQLATASNREQMLMLRRIHHSGATYLGDHVAMTFLTNGHRVLVDTRDRAVGLHLLHGGTWETHYTDAFKRMLHTGATVVDVGANLGWYTLVAAPIVGATGHVYAVEPNPRLASLLRDSLYTNGFLSWVTVFQVAVSDVPGVVDLVSHQESPGGGRIRPAEFAVRPWGSTATRVAAMPLDQLLTSHTGAVDVLKMDIEGWEGVALRGMTAMLDRSPGLRMMMEWGPGQDRMPVPRKEIAGMLMARGYLPFGIRRDGSLARESWDSALAQTSLTNLALLRSGDPLAVEVR